MEYDRDQYGLPLIPGTPDYAQRLAAREVYKAKGNMAAIIFFVVLGFILLMAIH